MIPEKYYLRFLELEKQQAIKILVNKENMDRAAAEKAYNHWRKLFMMGYIKINEDTIPRRYKVKVNNKKDKEIIDFYIKGTPILTICRELKVGQNTVYDRLKVNGIEKRIKA